ncbi:DUF1295 domain-containing protein [Pelomonas sp. KK5]|uniref:DUF1295 domain-containing protein n=1 Tax=Pelomonas sp. KK5 TaxID=1855730 RepID=UPI00097BED47|nr:DUF1295 domain-containing protein [Pelomonas sp. KK5]
MTMTLAAHGLLVALAIALPTWLASIPLRDASLADRIWSLMITGPALLYHAAARPADARGLLMLVLLLVWGLRLAVYVSWRNWGHGEDRRYADMRRRNEPGFAFKSLYIVFGLQALLAWIVSWPLLLAPGHVPLGWLDAPGLLLAGGGLLMEALADAQLARFRARPRSAGAVLDTGLWAWSRHPNYFGETCFWWGLGLLGLAGGAWWGLASPLVMTVLLLKVSGVTLLEADIADRRPAYRDYIARTSAFIPRPPRPRS